MDPDLCGPVSVGTVGVIRVLSEQLGIPLTEAGNIVDRCVFEGEEVTLEVRSEAAARDLLAALARTQAGPRIRAVVVQA